MFCEHSYQHREGAETQQVWRKKEIPLLALSHFYVKQNIKLHTWQRNKIKWLVFSWIISLKWLCALCCVVSVHVGGQYRMKGELRQLCFLFVIPFKLKLWSSKKSECHVNMQPSHLLWFVISHPNADVTLGWWAELPKTTTNRNH